MLGSEKIVAAGVASGAGEGHFRGQGRVGGFVLDRAGGSVGRLPGAHAARGHFDVATESAFARLVLPGNGVDVVGEEFLRGGDVNLALIFLHQLLPALVAGVTAQTSIFQIEVGFFRGKLRANRKI